MFWYKYLRLLIVIAAKHNIGHIAFIIVTNQKIDNPFLFFYTLHVKQSR